MLVPLPLEGENATALAAAVDSAWELPSPAGEGLCHRHPSGRDGVKKRF